MQIIIKNLFTDLSNYKIIKKPKYILETETETTTEPKLIMGIKTPLNTISIALQDRKKKNQKSLSKQNVNTTLPFIKGTKLWIQDFKSTVTSRIKMPTGRNQKGIFSIIIETESMKITQLERTRSVKATPPKRIERICSVSLYDTKSHQPLYLKEILT